MRKKIAGYPAWLTLSEDRTTFTLAPERAIIIRKIFEMSISGLGCYTIARQLNDQKVPAFGASGRWDQSTIDKMLRNRAVLGEHQPKTYTAKNKKGDPYGNPIPDYYPQTVNDELFDAAQTARAQNLAKGRGRKGKYVTNLFGKMVRCIHCESPVLFHSNVHRKSMICSKVLAAEGCYRVGWSYGDFENSIFELILSCLSDPEQELCPSELLDQLGTLIRSASKTHNYYVRMEIAKIFRLSVAQLNMAPAGPAPLGTDSNARIRRDRPGRYFEIVFMGGRLYRGQASPSKNCPAQH
jgi:hypothetical protein